MHHRAKAAAPAKRSLAFGFVLISVYLFVLLISHLQDLPVAVHPDLVQWVCLLQVEHGYTDWL